MSIGVARPGTTTRAFVSRAMRRGIPQGADYHRSRRPGYLGPVKVPQYRLTRARGEAGQFGDSLGLVIQWQSDKLLPNPED
jgi:hypothetical protein